MPDVPLRRVRVAVAVDSHDPPPVVVLEPVRIIIRIDVVVRVAVGPFADPLPQPVVGVLDDGVGLGKLLLTGFDKNT